VTDRLLGIETEYALVLTGPDQSGPRKDWVLAHLADRAASSCPTLPDGSGHGLFFQNGARFYTDCGHHPEMTTPEVANPWDGVRYVLAGERILSRLAGADRDRGQEALPVMLFKSNVDYDSRATWGCHESIMHCADPALLPPRLIPHLVSRIVFTGAGGFDPFSPGIEFMLSPRAAYLERDVSSESTSSRGIFHTKNETLCRGGFQRLHILCGESLCSERAQWLKIATTMLVVALIEAGADPGPDIELGSPIEAIRAVASDLTCRAPLLLASGSTATALEIQRRYLEKAEVHLGADFMPPWAGTACTQWRAMLDRLEGGPRAVLTTLDWAIKRMVFGRFASERGFSWSDLAAWTNILTMLAWPLGEIGITPRSSVIDALLHPTSAARALITQTEPALARAGLSWSRLEALAKLRQNLFEADVRFGEVGSGGIFAALDRDGVLTHHVAGVDNIEHAVENPPAIGRARVRSRVIRRLAHERDMYACGWSNVVNLSTSVTLDLSDPFETEERWVPAQRGGAVGERGPLGTFCDRSGPDPHAIRHEAYQSYLRGRYRRTETLLRTLIQRRFELPDSYSHLARALLMLDRIDEARDVVDTAWGLREAAPTDVVARLLWFQVYFSLIDGTDPSIPLGRLKKLLTATEAFNSWALLPLLEYLRPRLTDDAFGLLSGIFAAWCDRERLPDLQASAAWRSATPLDLP
jgi:proteasome accessory factor A